MTTLTATEAQRNFGDLLDQAARNPVSITKQGREKYVVMSAERYYQLTRHSRKSTLDALNDFQDVVQGNINKDKITEEEIRRDIAEAIADSRAENRTR